MKKKQPANQQTEAPTNRIYSALTDAWARYQRSAAWFWRYRSYCVVIPALAVFCVFFWFSQDSGLPETEKTQQTSNFIVAIVMAMLLAQLTAFSIAALHSSINKRFKWTVGVFLFPPIAFIYLWIAEE